MCDTEKPTCPKGLEIDDMIKEDKPCYYICQSRCKVETGYCGDGICNQERGKDAIFCRLELFIFIDIQVQISLKIY